MKKKLNLYLISQKINTDYDTYDSAVVCAPDEITAKNMNKYILSLCGHGVESCFIKLNEESFSFWFQKQKTEDFELSDYLCSPEEFEDIPEEFNFLIEDGESIEWSEHENVFCNIYSPDLESCDIIIDQIQDDGTTTEILCEKFSEFVEQYDNMIDYQNSFIEYIDVPDQVMECNSYEKGVIFGDIFEAEKFDPKLLKIIVKEAPNGVDYFYSASYNNEQLSNTECDTRGIGMAVNIWEK